MCIIWNWFGLISAQQDAANWQNQPFINWHRRRKRRKLVWVKGLNAFTPTPNDNTLRITQMCGRARRDVANRGWAEHRGNFVEGASRLMASTALRALSLYPGAVISSHALHRMLSSWSLPDAACAMRQWLQLIKSLRRLRNRSLSAECTYAHTLVQSSGYAGFLESHQTMLFFEYFCHIWSDHTCNAGPFFE
jgi:hypothetical protein